MVKIEDSKKRENSWIQEENPILYLEKCYLDLKEHLIQDVRPSDYLKSIYDTPCFQQEPFHMLHTLKNIPQSREHHPEGNVWNHTLLVVDEAAKVKEKSEDPMAFMWAALLHDVGKAVTTKQKKGRITAYDHDKAGERMAREFLSRFSEDKEFVDTVCGLIRYHMQILYVGKGLPFADIEGMKRVTHIKEVALLGLCDRLGRGHRDEKKEREQVRKFLEACGDRAVPAALYQKAP